MYMPSQFSIEDERLALAIAARRAFGVVVVAGEDGLDAAHVPFVLTGDRPGAAALRFHVARANQIHKTMAKGGSALCIVSGPDTYISPDWYDGPDQVPTWNYEAVHLSGPTRLLDAEELVRQVSDLSALNEARLEPKPQWKMDKLTDRTRTVMLRGIVGVEMQIETVEGKRKMSQNKNAEDYDGVTRQLRELNDPSAKAVATVMEGLKQAGRELVSDEDAL